MSQDAWARDVLKSAWPDASPAALQVVQAVGRFEGGYGHADDPAWAGSNNWGAIQCLHGPPCGDDCFEHTDTHADGSRYTACFRKYPTAIDGAKGLIHELTRRPGVAAVLDSGNLTAVAFAMRKSGYFEAPADMYAKALYRNAKAIAQALGEPLRVMLEPTLPTPGGPPASSPRPRSSIVLVAGVAWILYELARRRPGNRIGSPLRRRKA